MRHAGCSPDVWKRSEAEFLEAGAAQGRGRVQLVRGFGM